MYLHLIIIPAVFICDPGLGAAQLKVPVCHLAAHLLHAGCCFMLYIVRAVHQKITAAARAKQLAAQSTGLDGLIVKLIDLRVGDLAAHALLALPAIVQKLSEAVQIAFQQFILHGISQGFHLAHGIEGILLLVVFHLVLDDIRGHMNVSGIA